MPTEEETRERGTKMKVSPAFIAEVRDQMKERGWNQLELAEKSDISKSSLNRMLLNTGSASTIMVSRLAKFLGIADPTAQLDEEDIQRWVYVGTRLKDQRRAEFDSLLKKLEIMVQPLDKAVDTKREFMKRHK
jgi:transcriptional regulator with XRE-family HTH domain